MDYLINGQEQEDSNNNNNDYYNDADHNTELENITLPNGIKIPLIRLGLEDKDMEDVPTMLSALTSNENNLKLQINLHM